MTFYGFLYHQNFNEQTITTLYHPFKQVLLVGQGHVFNHDNTYIYELIIQQVVTNFQLFLYFHHLTHFPQVLFIPSFLNFVFAIVTLKYFDIRDH
jgi:hypothetical protein